MSVDTANLRLVNASIKGLETIGEALADKDGVIEHGEATTAAVAAAMASFKVWTKDQGGGTLDQFLELAREVWADLKL